MGKKKQDEVLIYFQEGCHSPTLGMRSLTRGPRIRFIYPNGEAKWESYKQDSPLGEGTPCWALTEAIYTQEKAVKLMHKYDRENNFPPAQLIMRIK